jgi:rhamnogalacturonyl hydrolase YesR
MFFSAEVSGGERTTPSGRRVGFGWEAAGLGQAVRLKFEKCGGPWAWLRVTVALSLRSCVRVGVFAGRSGWALGELDIRYAPAIQTFELPLDAEAIACVAEEGVELRMVAGEEAVWILTGGSSGAAVPEILRPHGYVSVPGGHALNPFLGQMQTLGCVQMFGWMEGCVLDGMLDLEGAFPRRRFAAAAREHLDLFLKDDGRLVFENMHSEPEENQLKTIEETLMFAASARVKPGHPSMEIARAFWEERHARFGLVTDPGMPSAEGCYTVGYPLAMAGKLLGVEKYLDWAIHELRVRRQRLVVDGDIWLRSYDDGRRTFRNWSRGVAWYFLGMVKTLVLLGERGDVEDLRAEVRRVADFVLARRTERGIWNGFVGESEIVPDAAGSAGIAAALAIGAREGVLGEQGLTAAREAVRTLTGCLVGGGLLGGVSQTNRGGEALQRSDYRVIFSMGMGLFAQAVAGQDVAI